jgi:hypothetical protein
VLHQSSLTSPTTRVHQRHVDTVYTDVIFIEHTNLFSDKRKMRRSVFSCTRLLRETPTITSRYARLLHTSTDRQSALKSTTKPTSPLANPQPSHNKRNQGTSTTSGFYDSNSAFQWQPGSEPGIDTSTDGVVSHGKTFPVNKTHKAFHCQN